MSVPAFRPIQASGPSIFRRDDLDRSLFYAPGYLVVASPLAADVLAEQIAAPDPPPSPAADLRRLAADAQRIAADQAAGPFRPVCLTLYLHNECNLRCTYCFAEAAPDPGPRLNGKAVRAAARLVAENCRTREAPHDPRLPRRGRASPTPRSAVRSAGRGRGSRRRARRAPVPLHRHQQRTTLGDCGLDRSTLRPGRALVRRPAGRASGSTAALGWGQQHGAGRANRADRA